MLYASAYTKVPRATAVAAARNAERGNMASFVAGRPLKVTNVRVEMATPVKRGEGAEEALSAQLNS